MFQAMPVTKEFIVENSEPITESGCWIWLKCIAPMGYGQLNRKRKVYYAHRLSFELFKGKISDGLHILHSCDIRSCVNPNHLRAGTNKDNIQDAVVRGTKKRSYKPRPQMIGKTWKLDPEICEDRRKIKTSMYEEIFELKSKGLTNIAIAARFNVTNSLIGKILKNGKS